MKRLNKWLACLVVLSLLVTQLAGLGTVYAQDTVTELTNVALNKTATASKDSGKGDVAANAVDGKESTRWYDGDQKDGNWLAVDLGKVYDISKIEIVWDPDPAGVYAPAYEIRTSENGIVYDKTVYTGTADSGAPQDFAVTESTRYIQLYITTHGKWGTAVKEFRVLSADSSQPEVPDTPDTPEEPDAPVEWPAEDEEKPVERVNLALNKPASASIEAVDQGVHRVAGMAVDGNEGTRWYDGDVSKEEGNWWQVDLGESYGLDEIEILWSADTVAKRYEIQVSEDGASWRHITTVDSQKTFPNELRHTMNVYGTGRYLRVYVLSRGAWGNSICEFKVYGADENKAGNHIDAEDGELIAGTGGALTVGELKEACGGKYVDGFYLDSETANDGAGVKFAPQNLFDETRTYLLYLGYARYFYEKDDTVGIYVNDTRVKTVNLAAATDNVNQTIRSLPIQVDLKKGDTITVRVDAAQGDHGYLRLDYIDLGVKVNRPSRDITMRYPHLALDLNETAKLFVNYDPQAEIQYFAEDPSVVSIEGDVATALKEGKTRIMARVKASPLVYAIGRITVGSVPEGAVVPVRAIALQDDSLTIVNRQSKTAAVTVTPEEAGTHLLWETSDPTVATVADGKIRALSEGTVTITAKSALNEAISDSLTVTITPNDTLDTIQSDQLAVLISKNFPMVYQYQTLKNGGVVQGNPNTVNQVAINGKNYTPQVQYEKVSASEAKYTLTVAELNAVITMTLKAENSNFKLDVTEIKEDSADDKRVFTFDMPNNVMLSMTNKDAQATFAGSKMQSNIQETGDTYYSLKYHDTVDSKADTGFLYAFLSNDKLSAGFRGNAMDSRILKQTTKLGDTYTTALWSGSWRYRANDYTKKFQDVRGDYGPKGEVVTHTYKSTYTEALPLIYISFAQGDLNNSGSVDWQDGAIAFREIMATATGMEQIPEAVVQRLIFPQAGEGNYPYISSLDETKRVYLATDGLGQLVLNKYHNEGIWGDLGVYDDFLGGHEDFNKYVSDATNLYNSWVGVHTNFTEIYPKARNFRPEKIMMEADGVTPVGAGFAAYSHWLQQVYQPDITFDAMSLERQNDLIGFKEAVPDLGFVYSDVFSGGGWKGRRLAEDYKAAGLSYFVEWPYQNEEEAVWAHWAVEKVYSPASNKAYASDIARFIFNHTKDRWDNNAEHVERVPNSCNLLMGADTTTYEGWPQRNTNNGFNKSMQVVFDNNLPSKYMQHFPILRMDKDSEGWATHIWFEENVEVYLDKNGKRTIEKDGKILYNQDSYLIPWNEGDINHPEDNEKEVKLYHYNENGGTTTWALPNSWDGLGTVYLYELTDLGRVNEKVLQVKDGFVTIEDAKAKTPYVVYKGEEAPQADVGYGDGTYVKDPGFNYGDLRAWTVDMGTPAVKKNDTEFDNFNTPNWLRDVPFGQQRNYELIIDGTDETQVSQVITGLTPGEYAASVMVEVQQGKERKASILIDNGEKTVTSYATKSILMDFDEYDSKLGTYMLRMRVNFVVPEGKDSVTLKLNAAAGEGKVRFDNVRVFETTLPTPDPETVEVKDKVIFFQDFELAQDEDSTDPLTLYKPTYEAYYPFNLGAARAIHETRTSIQKAHAPYTFNGTNKWDPSTVDLDDTLGGERALKVIGIDQKGIAVQTLPQSIRFEQGKRYRVSFKYQTQPVDDYQFVLGDGQPSGLSSAERQNPDNLVYRETLPATSTTKVYSHEFTADTDQLWFGIYRQKVSISVSTNPAPIVIDDVMVEEIVDEAEDKTELQALYNAYKDETQGNYTNASWAAFTEARDNAKAVLDNPIATQDEVNNARIALQTAVKQLAEKGDKTALNGLITDYTALAEADYTAESWSDFQAVLTQAKKVQADENATQSAVDNAYNQLVAARKDLVAVAQADKTELNALIASTEKLDTSNARPGKLQAYKAALDHAKEIAGKADATQDEVNAAATALVEAIVNLKDIVDKTNLDNLVNTLSQLKAGDYTAESFAVLTEALEKAARIDDDSSVAQVTEAYKGLQSAWKQLVRVEVNKNALANAIQNAKTILENIDSFKPITVVGLQEALDKAQAVYDDPNATQAQVKEATEALSAASAKAQVKEDKEVLFKAIRQAEALNEADYTPESFAALTRALRAAKQVAEDANADKEQIAKAAQDVETAIAGLKKASDGSGDSSKGDNSSKGDGSSSTGDKSMLPMGIALVVSLLGAAALVLGKRKARG